MPTVVIVAGPNGAGKTTFGDEYLSTEERKFEFVNADEIARGLDAQGIQARSDVLAARTTLRRVDELVQANADLMVETTLATLVYAQKIPAWRAKGYVVSLVISVSAHPKKRSCAFVNASPPVGTAFRKIRSIAVLKRASGTLKRFTSLSSMNGIYGKAERARSYSSKLGTKAAMSRGLDIQKAEAALKRAAHKAVHGTREERSGRVISSALVSVKYDAASGDLQIRFVNGRTYRYSNVPGDVYEALLNAESKGAFFNAQIRDRYPYREQA